MTYNLRIYDHGYSSMHVLMHISLYNYSAFLTINYDGTLEIQGVHRVC